MLKSFGKLFKECGDIIREEYNNTVYEIKNDKNIKQEIEGIKNSIDKIREKNNKATINNKATKAKVKSDNTTTWNL
jgi:hypothetical protein